MDARSARIQQRFEWPMVVAALLVIPALVLEESGMGGPAPTLGAALNTLIWAAFAVELVTMLAVTPDRWGWVRRHPLDVVIVLFTSPFMPASWQAARAFRLLRALRLLRIFSMRKLVSLEGVRASAFLAAFTVLAGGAIFASVERGANPRVDSTFDGIWWAMSTVTTVGYGDIIPKTDVGRAIGITIMLAGIGFVALLTAYVAERFVNTSHAVSEHEEHLVAELRTISERLHRLEARTAGRAEAVNGVNSGTNGAAEPQLTAGR